jgi:hypothetical protein
MPARRALPAVQPGGNVIDLVTVRDGPALVPATPFDLEQIERITRGRPARTVVTFPRSLPHQRWYRALVAVVADGLGLPPGTLHAELKFKAGLIEHIVAGRAGVAVELRSTAFAAMDEAEFTAYVRLAVEIIFRDYLPSVRREDVFAHVEAMVGPQPAGLNGGGIA